MRLFMRCFCLSVAYLFHSPKSMPFSNLGALLAFFTLPEIGFAADFF